MSVCRMTSADILQKLLYSWKVQIICVALKLLRKGFIFKFVVRITILVGVGNSLEDYKLRQVLNDSS